MVSLLFIAGCGKGSDSGAKVDPKLKKYISMSEDALDSLKASLGDTMDLNVTGEGSTLVYTYKYVMDVDKDQIRPGLESQKGTLETTAKNLVIPEMKKFGIKNAQVKYVYLDNNGDEIYSLLIK
jgi:hypothetical protein